MNKMKKFAVGIALGLLTLWMVVPTISTASADSYSSSGGNGGGTTAGVVIGVVAVGGIIDALASTPKPAPKTSTPQ